MEDVFDIVVAGGGVAGVLAAARLALARPTARIVLVEREQSLGGRLRGSLPDKQVRGYGFNAVSDQLYGFWRQTVEGGDDLAADLELAKEKDASAAESAEPPASESVSASGAPVAVSERRHQRLGVMAGGRIVSVPIGDWFSAKGARALGGVAAAREWDDVENILRSGGISAGPARPAPSAAPAADTPPDAPAKGRAGASAKRKRKGSADSADGASETASATSDTGDDDESAGSDAQQMAQVWKKPRRAPAAIVLEQLAASAGIPDLWGASTRALAGRAAHHAQPLHCGMWDEALALLASRPWFKERVTVLSSTRIVDASRDGDVWRLETEIGPVQGRSLVIAQSPWQAIIWLRRNFWPVTALSLATKTKPVSAVVIAETLLQPDADLPEVTVVPAEHAQIVRNGEHELCFQATIDYEMSMQAPAVVKAVRALKRARRKLLALHPGVCSESDHIALVPVAWAQSPLFSERRWLTRYARDDGNAPSLAFVGDAYGDSYDGDANVVRSLLSACTALTRT